MLLSHFFFLSLSLSLSIYPFEFGTLPGAQTQRGLAFVVSHDSISFVFCCRTFRVVAFPSIFPQCVRMRKWLLQSLLRLADWFSPPSSQLLFLRARHDWIYNFIWVRPPFPPECLAVSVDGPIHLYVKPIGWLSGPEEQQRAETERVSLSSSSNLMTDVAINWSRKRRTSESGGRRARWAIEEDVGVGQTSRGSRRTGCRHLIHVVTFVMSMGQEGGGTLRRPETSPRNSPFQRVGGLCRQSWRERFPKGLFFLFQDCFPPSLIFWNDVLRERKRDEMIVELKGETESTAGVGLMTSIRLGLCLRARALTKNS